MLVSGTVLYDSDIVINIFATAFEKEKSSSGKICRLMQANRGVENWIQ